MEGDNLYRAATGVVFRVKPVSVFLLDAIQRTIPRPEVPTQEVEGKDGKKRLEENPSHPAYIAAMEEYARASGEAVEHALLYLGTSIESLPDGMAGPDDTGWAAELAFLGIPVSDDNRNRYLAWLKYWGVRSAIDLLNLNKAVQNATLTSEEAVAAAAESFRSGA